MELLEKVAAPTPAAVDEKDESEDEVKPCHFRVRVKRPTGAGPWYVFGMLGGSEPGDDYTGHTFCAHEDEGDTQKWYGFYPKGALVDWNVPPEDQIQGLRDFFKYVAGELYGGDADHAWDEPEKVYVLDRARYDEAEAFARQWKQANTKYSMAWNNCTTFVVEEGRAIGCAIPYSGFPFSNPASFGNSVARSS